MSKIVLQGSATDLTVLELLEPAELFAPSGTEPVFEAIKNEVVAFSGDVTTESGRKEIASMAYKIAQSKNFLDKVGKTFNADLKEKTKAVDNERKAIWDKLEELQTQVRAPLTAWEDAEKSRVQAHKDAMAELESIFNFSTPPTLRDIEARVVRHAELRTRKWEEFDDFVTPIFFSTHDSLMKIAEITKQQENDRVELEVLRQAKAEQDAKDAEIARQKAANEETARIEREAKDKAERDAAAAIQAEKDRAAKAEADSAAVIAAVEAKAVKDKAEAEERARKADEARIAAEAKSKLEAEAAVQAEKDRAIAEKKRLDDEAKARENNRQHHAKINNEVVAGLAACCFIAGLSEDDAKKLCKALVIAIAEGKVPHTKISY